MPVKMTQVQLHRLARGKDLQCFLFRVVIKSRGPGIFPGYYESGLRLLLLENRRKIEPKEIPSRLIPRLLVLFTRQLEILVTTLLLPAAYVLIAGITGGYIAGTLVVY